MMLAVVIFLAAQLAVGAMESLGRNYSRDDFAFKEERDLLGTWTAYEIFSPYERFGSHHKHHHIATPEIFIKDMETSFLELDQITDVATQPPADQRARQTYLDFLATFLTGEAYGKSEKTVVARLGGKPKVIAFEPSQRAAGTDWSYLGKTMVGHLRLQNVQYTLEQAFAHNVPGAFVEAGVWRGGVDIFARGVIRAHHQAHRPVIVCDSFAGLPPGIASLHGGDVGWDKTTYLEVSAANVARNFVHAGLLDDNVFFAKGFFNNSMPHLGKQVKRIAVLRLDGDMYQSTVDVLYHLYDQVSVGGFVIVDDWAPFPAKDAVLDYFNVHGIDEKIIPVDRNGVYWQKTKKTVTQYWRYQQSKFK